MHIFPKQNLNEGFSCFLVAGCLEDERGTIFPNEQNKQSVR